MDERIETTLPLKGISSLALRGMMFVNGSDDVLKDTMLKMETYICDAAKRKSLEMYSVDVFPEDDAIGLMDSLSVISPLTVMEFFYAEGLKSMGKEVTPAKMEAFLLDKMPDRFSARYKDNLGNRHARDCDYESSDDDGHDEDGDDERVFSSVVDDLFADKRPDYIEDWFRERKGA